MNTNRRTFLKGVGGALARGVLASAGLLGVLELVVDNLKGLGCVKRSGLDLAGVGVPFFGLNTEGCSPVMVGTGFSPPLCRVDSLGGFGTVRRFVLVARGFLLVGLIVLLIVPAPLVARRVALAPAFGIGLARNCFLHSSACLSSVVRAGAFLVVLGCERRDTASTEGAPERRAEVFGALYSFTLVGLVPAPDLLLSIRAILALVGRG